VSLDSTSNKSGESLLDLAKKEIPNLHNLWRSVDDEYPADYQSLTEKSKALIECLPLLVNCRVLDIGCNAGFYSILLGKVAHSVTGVDPSDALIHRAKLAHGYFEDAGHSLHHVRFLKGNFAEVLPARDFDAVLASLVLYHVGDANILVLKEALKTKVSKILIQCRPARDVIFTQKPECGPIATTTLYNGLYKIEDCLSLLRDCGFANATVLQMNIQLYGEHFPIIYAQR
jgi:SAM-dependent methyltransferase